MTNISNNSNCKSCEFFKVLIRDDNKEKSDYKKRIRELEQEIKELKKQKISVSNNKSFSNCSNSQQKRLLDAIHENLSKPLKDYFDSYGMKIKILTLKTGNNNHLIDFENSFTRRNVGDVEMNKFISYHNMNENQKIKLRQTLSEIEINNISERATNSMNANKFNTFSNKQLFDLKKELNENIPIVCISDNINKVFGTYLNVDFAFRTSIEILAKKKKKVVSDLKQPLTMKLSIDGTVKNNRNKYVAYTLCAYEYNDKQFMSTNDLVLLALLADDERYDILKYYFESLHKSIQEKISTNYVIIDESVISFVFIMCSDLKSLLTFIGMNSANSKYSCIYCTTEKQDFCKIRNFFDENKFRNRSLGGLGREIEDWTDVKRAKFGIKNDMIIKINPENYVIDTLHLRIRLTEKIFSSIISSLINYSKSNKVIEDLNKELQSNNINANIYSELKSEFFNKYKLRTLSLNTKIKSMDSIVNYINEKFKDFKASKYFSATWKKWKDIFELIEKAQNSDDSISLKNKIEDIYDDYKLIHGLNLAEFGNNKFTPYMHLLCHIPDLILRYGKISVFNCQATEDMNNLIKLQINNHNNRSDTTKLCIEYFSRKNLLIDYRRKKRDNKKWSEQSKIEFSQRTQKLNKERKNNINIPPLK